jgi:glycosyltransferase involved in cell wall biosynthesis
MLFYNDWPLGYHNQEAERKARAFAVAGYDVTFLAGAGVRNPRASSAWKAVDRLSRRLGRGKAVQLGDGDGALRGAALLVAPPRQVQAMRHANLHWVERQLRAAVPGWPAAVAWVRSATPELVEVFARKPPAALVYEAVDAHHHGPGMTGIWRDIFERGERRLVEQADVVVVTNAPLAERFLSWGADVRHVPHGVDLFPWRPRPPSCPITLGFVGVLDGRLDVPVLRHVAQARPDWHIRLVGPIERGFDPAAVHDLPNVSVEPPVPHHRVGAVLDQLDLGLLAYADLPAYAGGFPLKLLELFAAGRTAVVRPNATMDDVADLVFFASTPEEFLAQAERALADEDIATAHRRRAVAEGRSWTRTTDCLRAILAEVLEKRGLAGPGSGERLC